MIRNSFSRKHPRPKPVRLLHVVGDSSFGGGSVVIHRLSDMSRHMGWQVDVLTTDHVFQQLLRQHNLGVVHLEGIHREINLLQDTRGLLRLWWFLLFHRYDLVHTHTSKAGFIGRLAARAAGVRRIIHTVHGFAFHEESDLKTVRRYAMLERIAAYACDLVVTVSQYHRRWALDLKIGGANKIVAIPNGISLDRAKTDRDSLTVRQELAVAPGTCLLLSVGRLAEQKGLEYLLQALPRLKSEMKVPFKLILVGTGPHKPKLKTMIRELGLRKQVTFLGFRKDVGNLLAASDIAVLPSLHEGLSIALLEAMAAGKPIITTNIGSNLEVTRNGAGAVLVPAKDSAALAGAIGRLANDFSLRVSKSQQAKALYHKHYTEDRMLESYRTEYLQLLSSTRNRAVQSLHHRLPERTRVYRTEASS